MDAPWRIRGLLVVAVEEPHGGAMGLPGCVRDADYAARSSKGERRAAGTATRRSSASTAHRAAATSELRCVPGSPLHRDPARQRFSPEIDRAPPVAVSPVQIHDSALTTIPMRPGPELHLPDQQGVLRAVGDDRRREIGPAAAPRRSPVVPVPDRGALGDNVLPEMQEKFAATYRAAGGVCGIACSNSVRSPDLGRQPRPADRQGARTARTSSRADQGLTSRHHRSRREAYSPPRRAGQ